MAFDPEQITFFAKTDARGAEVPFGIKAIDRTKHVYVIGKTGMGKSTLLENMAVQDIQNGNGMAFIDPHGQTAELLLDYIPEHRKQDVLYFAPFDTECPIAFNVMEDVGPEKRHLVVSGLMSVFKKIWVDAWSARMEYILQNTLLALLEYPDSTLLGVNRMLSDKHYRRKVIDNITDPAVKSFWVDEFLNYNERYMQEAGDSIKNKIGQFTANPIIRNIVGQPKSSFDLRQIMDEQKIVIMNLSKGLVGESNANLLGSMLTTRLYLAAMSRADVSQEELKQMPNFYFYVDEFQSFANATFADILSEARKYKLNLTIAHQYIEQMEEEVRNAVFGNVGTTITFRVGPFDAETLETIFAPQFYAVDICNLSKYQIYLSLMIDGVGSKPFSAATLPPIAQKDSSCKEMIIHESRQQFSSERSTVEGTINDWHEMEFTEDKPKNGTGGGSKSGGNGGNGKGNGERPKKSNGNSNGGASNGGNGKGNGERPRKDGGAKDKPKEQSLADLRAVLETLSPEKKAATPDAVEIETNKTATPRTVDETPSVASPTASETETDTKAESGTSQGAFESGQKGRVADAEELRAAVAATSQKTVVKEPVQSEEVKPQPEKTDAPKPAPTPAKPVAADPTPAKEVVAEKATPPKQSEKPTKPAPSLRSALAEVLEEKRTSVVEEQPVKTAAVAVSTESSAAAVETATTPAAHMYKEIKNRDPLDPKKLERMMRVTTADKTPIK